MIPRPALEAAVERLRAKEAWLRKRTHGMASVRAGLSLFAWRWLRLVRRSVLIKIRALEARLKEM